MQLDLCTMPVLFLSRLDVGLWLKNLPGFNTGAVLKWAVWYMCVTRLSPCCLCSVPPAAENLLVNQNSQRNLVLVLADFGASLALEQAMLPFQMQLTLEYWPPEMWQHVGSYLASLPTNQG